MPVLINNQSGLAEDLPHEQVQPALDAGSHGVPLNDPSGNPVIAPFEHAQNMLSQGHTQPTPEQLHSLLEHAKYSSAGQQAATLVEGAGEGLLPLGATTALERALGVSGKDITGRRETNPGTHMLGQGAGLVGSAFVPGGQAKFLENVGQGVVSKLGIDAAERVLPRIGSQAVKQAAEFAMIQGGDEASKAFAGDPTQSLESAVTDIGLSSLMGAGFGGTIGGGAELWKATAGKKLEGVLNTLQSKGGGVAGVDPSLKAAIDESGVAIPPEINAGLTNDPHALHVFKTLEQSDVSKSGRGFQQTLDTYKKDLSDSLVRSFDKDPATVGSTPELSKYEAGKTIGNQLADEYHQMVDPLSKEFDALSEKYSKAPLIPDTVKVETVPSVDGLSAPESITTVVPGTASQLSDRIGQLAVEQGWTASPSSDIMKEVSRVMKELPSQTTAKDLRNYISAVGDNMQSDPLNGPLRRAGGMIKSLLKDAEADIIAKHLGEVEGAEAAARFRAVRESYRIQSDIKEALDSRLHARGSTSGYAKSLKEMAQTDGEKVLQRLSGKNDADLLQFLQTNFPKTAQLVKDYHVDSLLQGAMAKAKPGEVVSASHLIREMGKLSPELRDFALPIGASQRAEAVDQILSKLNQGPYNHSNTARTLDGLMGNVPASAIGMVTMLASHNPITAVAAGLLTKKLGRDVPDAMRLSMLKFMGSDAPVNPSAFKTMVDAIQSAIKGEAKATRAVKSVFKAGADVIPIGSMPSPKALEKLDKQIKVAQQDPKEILNKTGDLGHYLPDHAQAAGSVMGNATSVLAALRPNEDKMSPLEPARKPNSIEVAKYNRALAIAEQPLVTLSFIKDGTLTPEDVHTLQAIYPSTYESLKTKLMSQITDLGSKGERIPYKAVLGLTLFMGMPLESSTMPQNVSMNQPPPQPPAQQTQGSPKGLSAEKGKGMSKLSQSYATAGQSREASRGQKA